MFTGLSFRYTRWPRSSVTTMRASVSSFTVFVFGTSTSMPDCKIGAVIMKMMSNTSTTSMNGTMLISESDVPVSRCTVGIAFSPRLRAVKCFDFCDELGGEAVHARRHAANVVKVVVVSDERRDGREKSGSGCDERFGNSRRHGAQARRSRIAQP